MQLRTDFHIHTTNIGCANETMTISAILAECEQLGLDQIAITDHLNRLDQADTHKEILAELQAAETPLTVFFAAELNFDGDNGSFAIDYWKEDDVGFQFFIGGIHSAYGTDRSPREIFATHHQHHLKTCHHPQVSVLVHPYWFSRKDLEQMPWLTDLSELPREWVLELGETAVKTNTAIEINGASILLNQNFPDSFQESYKEFLAALKDCGVQFALSSDAHSITKLSTVTAAEQLADELAIPDHQIWKPNLESICTRG